MLAAAFARLCLKGAVRAEGAKPLYLLSLCRGEDKREFPSFYRPRPAVERADASVGKLRAVCVGGA